ncbi:MAG: TonB-dependent receptor, partial [Myxococcota bacterium]
RIIIAGGTGGGAMIESNSEGVFYLSSVPSGALKVRVEAPGYEPNEEVITIGPGGVLDHVFVMFKVGAAEVIEIRDTVDRTPPPPGKQDLGRDEITRIPGTRGDALSSILSMPGVTTAAGGPNPNGPVVIRGAAPEDSVVTIDGIEIPLLYHFGGLQSILPSEFIDTIEYLPGGFGAERGRSTGGVINIKTRTQNADEFNGFAEMSFINFAGLVYGPLSKKHNVQMSAALRRSFIDVLLPAVIPDDTNLSFTTAPQYYDGQLRIDWKPNSRHHVSLLNLMSFDLLSLINDNVNPNEPDLTGKFDNETSFTRSIASWQYRTPALENRLSLSAGTTASRIEVGDDIYSVSDDITVEARNDLTWRPGEMVQVRAGGEASYSSIDLDSRIFLPPGEGSGGQDNISSSPRLEYNEQFTNNTAAAYAAADIRPLRRLTVSPGVRLDYYDRIAATELQPRLSAQYLLGSRWTLRGAVGRYTRPLSQVEALQDNLEPERATQYVVGADYQINDGISLSGSGFYTDRENLVVQDEMLSQTDPYNAYVNRGTGRAFGVEALARAKIDNFFGWVSYTISRSDRIDEPGMERRLFDYDQTHNLVVVASYTYGPWQFGGRWQYTTGQPLTEVQGSVYNADLNIYTPVYGEINGDRLAASHQLDLRIDRVWKFDQWSLSAYLDVSNVYYNPSTLDLTYNFDYSESQEIEDLPILPAIGLRGEF